MASDLMASVCLVDGVTRHVKYNQETTVQRVLDVVIHGIGMSDVAIPHFGLRLVTTLDPSSCSNPVWLHPSMLVCNIRDTYAQHFVPRDSEDNLKFELRLRFVPQSAYELLLTEPKAFFYLHDQVFNDFLYQLGWKMNQEIAIELAALRISRQCAEKQMKNCMEKKAEICEDDIEYAIQTFIPRAILCLPNCKVAVIKKQLHSQAKKFLNLPPTQSVLQSLSILIDVVKFDVEVFKASLGAGWDTPVDLLVGPEVDISYRANERCDLTRLAELRSVLEVNLKREDYSSHKTIVRMKLSGSAQPLYITVASFDIAESLTHLIDGYQMLYNQGGSVYTRKGLQTCDKVEMNARENRKHVDRMNLKVDAILRIKRENVTLKELLGGGQFGNVYKGLVTDEKGVLSTAAIKVCKLENEPADTQLILQEFHLMMNLRHEHIISLIGICMDNPIWLVMELAPLGELRQYLQSNVLSLSISTLFLFIIQIAKALHYLHQNSVVHRDIAARNVLVFSPSCVKLTDFGLSRTLDYNTVYTSSRGKLPIKWLAPESINFREFSIASDVWMFGVCMWEILSWGVKPWQGIKNTEVISQIETGVRPQCPNMCPPALYSFLELSIWSLEPVKRPDMAEITKVLELIDEQIKDHVHIDDIKIPRIAESVPVILTEIDELPSTMLWRTLEEQRRQAEEDDKWLEDQEDLSTYDPEVSKISSGVSNLSLTRWSHMRNGSDVVATNGTPNNTMLTTVVEACNAVSMAVDHLTNTFNKDMPRDQFMVAVKDITSKLREMFSDATNVLKGVTEKQRQAIERTEALIANDMLLMSNSMQELMANLENVQLYNSIRREVVQIAKELSFNCQNFCAQLTTDRPSTHPSTEFRAIISDC